MHSRSPLTLLLALGALTLIALPQSASAQGDIAEPFKVGTFEIDGTPQVALVLRDRLVVAIQPANRDLERNDLYPVGTASTGRWSWGR